MTMFENGDNLTGHPVMDDHHHKIGTVSDVLFDDDGTAAWAVVDPGPLRAEHAVPLDGSYLSADGDVMIPYGKDQVKHSPKVGRDHVLDADVETELRQHYDVG